MGLSHADQIQSLAWQATGHAYSPVRMLLKSYQSRLIYRDQDLLNYLEWNQRCLAAMDLPLSNAIPALLGMERDAEKFGEKKRISFLNTFKKERISFLNMIDLHMSYFLLPEAGAVAQVRVTRTALAVERWRLAHDAQVPDSLTELVPDVLPTVPIDPFDGRSLRYKKLTPGYVVYSVGSDFVDDGGKEKSAAAKASDPYDIPFTVNR